MSATCEACKGPRRMGQGNAELCAKCYARKRRGGLKTKEDPERGKRVASFQVAVTPQLLREIATAIPDPVRRAEWARQMLREGLEVLRFKVAYGVNPG